jgi:hypothetical protein
VPIKQVEFEEISMRTSMAFAAWLLASVALAQVPSGGPYRLPKQVIAGGGERASGGSYQLTGTVGQSTTASITGSAYVLQQGFHSSTNTGSAPDPIFRNGFE